MCKHIRTTVDDKWDEEELRGDVYDVCVEVMTPKLLEQYKYRALKDKDLLLPQYMAEQILNQIEDVVELYDVEYYKHCSEDSPGIRWYDKVIIDMIHKELNGNLVS